LKVKNIPFILCQVATVIGGRSGIPSPRGLAQTRNDEGRSLSFGTYLSTRWPPGEKLQLARSTWGGYRRKIEGHILPTLGKVAIRRLRPHHLEALYDQKLHPTDGQKPPAPKTVPENHLFIRGAFNDAVRRGVVIRNVALMAAAPKLGATPKTAQRVDRHVGHALELASRPRSRRNASGPGHDRRLVGAAKAGGDHTP